MKNKIIASMMVGIMALTPITVYAEEDLEARITALEERVAALEAQLGTEAPTDETENESSSENSLIVEGFTLAYKNSEVTKDKNGNDCVILYFDFINESDEPTSALFENMVNAYQNNRELEKASVSDNEAISNWNSKIMPSPEPLEVAVAFSISDMSDISVELVSAADFLADHVLFTIPLE